MLRTLAEFSYLRGDEMSDNPVAFILGVVLFGSICGLIPFSVDRKKGRQTLGIVALLSCVLADVLAGLLLAVPVAILSSIVISQLKSGEPM